MDKIEEEIEKLKEELQTQEDTHNDAYLDEELKQLRHYIMFAHFSLERSLELILGVYVKGEYQPSSALDSAKFYFRMSPILDRMEFWNKLEACEEAGLISGALKSLVATVNNHRKYFSHPASHSDKIREYSEREKYRQTLSDLKKALDAMNEHFSKNLPKAF